MVICDIAIIVPIFEIRYLDLGDGVDLSDVPNSESKRGELGMLSAAVGRADLGLISCP